MLADAGFLDHVSVNYSFNVIDERLKQSARPGVSPKLVLVFGADLVEPAIFSSVFTPTSSSTGLIRA